MFWFHARRFVGLVNKESQLEQKPAPLARGSAITQVTSRAFAEVRPYGFTTQRASNFFDPSSRAAHPIKKWPLLKGPVSR